MTQRRRRSRRKKTNNSAAVAITIIVAIIAVTCTILLFNKENRPQNSIDPNVDKLGRPISQSTAESR